jgi:membrane protease YdiL (CAAX protease family)
VTAAFGPLSGYGARVEALSRRTLRSEILLVLGVSLGYSAIYAAVDLVGRLTATKALAQQTATLNGSAAPGRPWLDLAFQLVNIGFGVVPALLALHLLRRDHDHPATVLGLYPPRPGFDVGAGAALAALIGLPGLGLYLAAHAAGINATVVPAALPHVWWTVPVLLLSAAENAVLEEVVVVGYLMTRLSQLGWRVPAMVVTSALLRGSYHLYQGFGGFLGNAVMGVVFSLFYLRWKRVGPLVLAHTILDAVAFVGYALFYDQLTFLH